MHIRKIGIALALAGIVATAVYTVDANVRDKSTQRFTQKLSLLGTLRKSALDAYLATIRAEVTFWSVSESLRGSGLQIAQGWNALPEGRTMILQKFYSSDGSNSEGTQIGQLDESAYATAHADFHALAADFVSARGYYDFFLINDKGDIIYTVQKESDFATNLNNGPFKETGLANVFRRAMNENDVAVHFSDFESYAPSNDAPAIFAARRMLDATGEPIGVLALQLPTAKIVEIMQFDAGMGETGETYLVGEDLLMRSDSRFSEASTILRESVDTKTVALALDGERGVMTSTDYRGIEVLSAYDSLEVDGFRWAVMAEIDSKEVRSETGGIGGILAAFGLLLYGLILATISMIAGLNGSPGSARAPVDGMTDFDGG